MARIIGLDFGTTNTRILLGYSGRPDQVTSIDLPESDRGSLPTVILVDDQGKLQELGRAAEEALREPTQRDSVRFEFKPCLGRSEEDLSAQSAGPALQLKCPDCGAKIPEGFRFCGECGQPLPEDYREKIAERSLRYGRDEAFEYAGLLLEQLGSWIRQRTLGGGGWETEDLVVVGVPVHWSEATRDKYADLARRSFGSEQVKTVDEPHAALAEYLSRAGEQVKPGEAVLVIDVGGGTTDLVAGVVQADGTLDKIQRHGIRFGGADFDDAVVHWAMGQLSRPPEMSEDQLAGGLRPQCRELKEQLSNAVRTGLQGDNPQRRKQVMVPPLTGELVLDRTTFESDDVAGPLFSYFSASLTEALRQMGLRAEDLHHVLLIGGGSNAYFVEHTTIGLFPQAKIVVGQQPEMAIGRGLVVTVARPPVPRGKEQVKSPADLLIEKIEALQAQEQWEKILEVLAAQPPELQAQPRILYYRLRSLHKLGRNEDLLAAAKGHENDHPSIAKLVARAKADIAGAQAARQKAEGPALEMEVERPQASPSTSATAGAEWHLSSIGGPVNGPYPVATICEWLRTGTISREYLAHPSSGTEPWLPLYQIAEFKAAAEQQAAQAPQPPGAAAVQAANPPPAAKTRVGGLGSESAPTQAMVGLRLRAPGTWYATDASVDILFDDQIVGNGSVINGFDLHVRCTPGPHIVQLRAWHIVPRYGIVRCPICVNGAGDYEAVFTHSRLTGRYSQAKLRRLSGT